MTRQWNSVDGWDEGPAPLSGTSATSTLVLAFWSPATNPATALRELCDGLPGATVVGCSTAGQIVGEEVTDTDLVATIVDFESTEVGAEVIRIGGPTESRQAGSRLGEALLSQRAEVPAALIVICDGLVVNGTELVTGLSSVLPAGLPVSGGLAGDGPSFDKTWVSLGDTIYGDAVVGIGLWGDSLTVNHGSAGGWQGFGPKRVITRSEGSTLFELDGQPALDLYRAYLGEQAVELPSSALLFPLQISSPNGNQSLVRTVLAVDTDANAMRFAGDIPQGWNAQLMRTTFDRLIDGAVQAASEGAQHDSEGETLAIAVSCVGRRLVMGDRVEDEAEACQDVLGPDVTLRGFYSYGEISPVEGFVGLHNQTMTLTTLSERSS